MSRFSMGLIAVIVIVLLTLFALALSFPQAYSPMFGHRGGMMHPWMMAGGGFWILLILLFIVLLAAGVVLLFQSLSGGRLQDQAALSETPLQILKRRYASGEITKEQYQEMKQELDL